MAQKITIKLGDDNDRNYSKTVELMIPTKMHRILSNRRIDDMDEYDEMWDQMCDMISYENRGLPRSWFIDKITW